jgi:hypothetical protein
MNYTNRHNIPPHICKWLELDSYDYDPNVISATTLINPARAFVLKKLHADDLTMDYSDLLSARYGTAIHDSLEKAGVFGKGDFKEKRFYCEVLGVTISGKVDAVIDGVIRDNKSTSVWKFVKQEFDDYIKQLSIYRYILHRNGIETESFGMIDFFFTDWKKSDAEKSGGTFRLSHPRCGDRPRHHRPRRDQAQRGELSLRRQGSTGGCGMGILSSALERQPAGPLLRGE